MAAPVWPIENGKQLLIWSCHTHFNHPFRNNLDHHFYAIFVSPFCFPKQSPVTCFVCMKTSLASVFSCVCVRVSGVCDLDS